MDTFLIAGQEPDTFIPPTIEKHLMGCAQVELLEALMTRKQWIYTRRTLTARARWLLELRNE